MEYWVLSLATFSAYLHVVLIAMNRGFSMLFPLSYETVWTRRTCQASVVAVWMVNFVVLGYAIGVYALVGDQTRAINYWSSAFAILQYATVGVSVGIYTVVFGVLLTKSLLDKSELAYSLTRLLSTTTHL